MFKSGFVICNKKNYDQDIVKHLSNLSVSLDETYYTNGVRIQLKVPATQRHHRERVGRSRWLAIPKVRILYGLPTYLKIYFMKNKIWVDGF
jgi:hypothetical protein